MSARSFPNQQKKVFATSIILSSVSHINIFITQSRKMLLSIFYWFPSHLLFFLFILEIFWHQYSQFLFIFYLFSAPLVLCLKIKQIWLHFSIPFNPGMSCLVCFSKSIDFSVQIQGADCIYEVVILCLFGYSISMLKSPQTMIVLPAFLVHTSYIYIYTHINTASVSINTG